ncbi:alpha/beta fold hydrolase, partial [candidate division KSB1 bacterium]|nr:alpha/beta fold hydrolase [candidate division KSB1 bacterium]NIT74556.1 alpha/beta fold hydrolase [candidate division KSB1 bacterium]NIU28383.1 alpha/beta fold hydrolase [candidate division KSB1 bacterium]NIU90484.1 alpha/beta fold hydrolase [candidate division KSB1 bacterium]NIW22305.1 alpha/beta fold hydrolase [candidate division KSB1 bacterium]
VSIWLLLTVVTLPATLGFAQGQAATRAHRLEHPTQAINAYEEKEVEFANGEIKLAGVILLPKRIIKAPGIVIIHGSGSNDRTNAWAAAFAMGLAERGIAMLLPDKRGSGRSSGDWKRASFEDLADDAIAGVETLRGYSQVKPGSVGVLGLSQGGHIAPLAATRSSHVAFVINISGSTVPITEQMIDEVEKLAERAGFTEEQIDRVNVLHGRAIDYGLTEEGWEDYHANLERELKDDLAGHDIIEPFPSSRDHWVWQWVR